MPCVSGNFCHFKFALPSLLSMSKDEVKAALSDFNHGPCRGGLHPKNPLNQHFSQPHFMIEDHCTLEHVSIPKRHVHFTGNKCFLPEFLSLLLSSYALNSQTGHGHKRDLVQVQFSLYHEWYSQLMYNTYHIEF